MKVIIYILIIASVLIAPVFACLSADTALADCNQPGTTVVFINGMFTPTQEQAKAAERDLEHQYNVIGKNSNVTFLLGYNESHIAQVADLVDAVTQAYLGGYQDYDLTTILRNIHSQINTQKILFVGHSQGSFYANAAYDYLTSHGADNNSVAVYNVANPADVVAGNGKYLTSSNDKVISQIVAGLTAAFSAKKPLAANISLPLSAPENADPMGGHSFSDVYLAEAPDRIVSDMDKEIGALQASNNPKTECYTEPPADAVYLMEDFGYKTIDGAIAYFSQNATPSVFATSSPEMLSNVGNIAYGAGADLIGSIYNLGAGLLGGSSSSDPAAPSDTGSTTPGTGSATAQAPTSSAAPNQDALDNLIEQLDANASAGQFTAAAGAGIPPVQASCSAVPNPGTTNQQVTFTATATGGLSSNYSYSWSGDCVLTPSSPANANCLKTFTSAGNYAATVTVTPWPPGLVQVSGTATCPVVINTPPPPYFNLAVCYLGATGTQAVQARYGYTASNLNPGTVTRNTVTNNGIIPQNVPVGTNTARVWSSNTYQLNANNYVWTVAIDGTTKTSTIDTLNGHAASFYDTMRCPAVCGDGFCTGAETCSTCSSDCGTCGGGGGGDTTPPVITLLGSPTVNLTAGNSYTDAGATALDNVDGDITSKIVVVNPVNTSTAGTYTITYNVSDAAGNAAAQVTRTVIVNPAKLLITEVQTQGADAYQDFIELYNPNNIDIYLNNYRLVKRAETSSSDTTIKSWSGDLVSKIAAKSYYLWGSSTDSFWPALISADVWTQQNISSDNGIAIRYGPADTGQVIDAVGWGTFNNVLYESSAFPQNPGANQGLGRKLNGENYQDTDNNPNDFQLEPPTPGKPNAPDTTPPVITLNGLPELTVTVGHSYADAGASATDNFDGDISSKIITVNPVNTAIKGDYPISYNVSDSAGNPAKEVIRLVHIVDPFPISCSASPSTANANDQVSFTPQITGSFATCTYSWTGDCTGGQQVCNNSFKYSGNYTATVQASCDGQFSLSYGCTVGVLAPLPPTIVSITNPADIAVLFGTPFANLGLPATVSAGLSDGSTAGLAVTWSTAGYDGNTSQTYSFTGTLNTPLPDNITNPNNLSALMHVTVQPYVPHLLITEIQTAGATGTKDEFIELYNPTALSIDLTDYSLKKETTGGTSTASYLVSPAAFTGSIAASGYFLVVPQGNTYTGSQTPDLTYSGASYSIADDNTILIYNNIGTLVDKVGYGAAVDYETAPTVNPAAGQSITRIYDRNSAKYQDTNNNLADFITQKYPTPKDIPPLPLSVFCSAQASPVYTGQSAVFVAQVTGGVSSSYTYSWTGACTGASSNCTTNPFAATGTYTTALLAASRAETGNYSCSVDVVPPLPQANIKDITGCLNPNICPKPNYSSAGPGTSSSNDSAGVSYYWPKIRWTSPDSNIASYHVQYRRNGGDWQDWFASTTNSSGTFGANMVPKALYDMLDDESYSFRVSAKNTSGIDGLWQQIDLDLRNPVVINEVAPFGGGAGSDGWLEIYNKSDSGVDLAGWQIIGGFGASHTLTINLSGIISAKTYLVIDKATYFPASAIPTSGYLYLQTNTKRQTDSFYIPGDTGWAAGDFQKDNLYYSMERVSPFGRGDLKDNWKLSASENFGTPGNENTVYQLYTPISTDFAEGGDLPVYRDGVPLSPYLLQGFPTVYQNKTLTIEPGVVLKFIDSETITTPSGLMVWGNLQAKGTSDSPIVFTSIHDDDYAGDSDQDGGDFAPVPGLWNGIKFTADSSGSQLDNIIVRYAGNLRGFNSDFGAGIKVDTSAISLSNSTIEKNKNNGLYLVNSASIISSVQILDNNTPSAPITAGIRVDDGSPTISNADFERNYYGIYVLSGTPAFSGYSFGSSPDNNNTDYFPAGLFGPP